MTTTTLELETARVPGVSSPGGPPRAPFGGKRRLFNVVPVRFERSFISELYNAGELWLRSGESVVVDTPKGPALAEVCGVVERRVLDSGQVGRIIRRASADDRARHVDNRLIAREAFKLCVQRIRARDLDMKLCQVEYMLDRSRVLFYFSAERRVDFRQLVRDLARQLDARIEMRQVGVRDGAGLIGGIGPCGKELCCSSFLTSFRSISIRHAKDQGLTLNPKKVSGMCGRLMCCLVYEHPTYRKAKKGAPRINRAVATVAGEGVVTEVHLLQRKVRVLLVNGSTETFPFAEVVVDNETIRRARDIQTAAPARRRAPTMNRAGSNLREEYVWDGAEADDPKLVATITDDDAEPTRAEGESPSRRRSSRGRSEAGGQSGPGGQPGSGGQSPRGEQPPRSSRHPRRRRSRARGAAAAANATPNQPTSPTVPSEPRTSEPRTSEPRTSEPRTSEPRTSEPRAGEPRTGEPESGEQPRARRRRRRRRSRKAGGPNEGGGGESGGPSGGQTGGQTGGPE